MVVAVEYGCCCGVWLLLWSMVAAVEYGCCCGVWLLLWSMVVAVETESTNEGCYVHVMSDAFWQ
jgi:hypothetical protein